MKKFIFCWLKKTHKVNFDFDHMLSIGFYRTDSKGNNPIRTQPRTKFDPWMYDYTGYALTSGN